ncbi:MAG: glycosyltransferase family 4 protein [Chloroflexota bacterium]
MKALYVALHNPTVLDLASGVDYFHYQAMLQDGFEVKWIAPNPKSHLWIEEMTARAFQRTGKRFVKYPMSTVWRASQVVNEFAREWKPDVILTMNMASMVFYHGDVPAVLSRDTTFYGQQQFWPVYGRLAMAINMWQEKLAFRNSARVLTNSQWSKKVILATYGASPSKVDTFVLPSALPVRVIPERVDVIRWKKLESPFRLLLVGRDTKPPRKGINIAIEVVHKLNIAGLPAELTICGTQGESDQYIKYVGPFTKSNPEQLDKYVDLYRWAHLLIHPAIFEAAGIVPSEAAAFGTPTITNDSGGLATTVADGESGIVLPTWSKPQVYVKAVMDLVKYPETYYALCRKTRERYERELNWSCTGAWMADVLRKTVQDSRIKRNG